MEGLKTTAKNCNVKTYTHEEVAYLKKKFWYWAKTLVPNFKIDENNKAAIDSLFLYFIGIEQVEMPLQKGILLMGGVGTGKTSLMYCFRQLAIEMRRGFAIETSDAISRNYEQTGTMEKYLAKAYLTKKHVTLCIDDVGREPDVSMHMGNRRNIVEALLLERYILFKNFGAITHATTNLDADGLKSRYGEAAYDRMREMFSVVALIGKSRRV